MKITEETKIKLIATAYFALVALASLIILSLI
jgi:hypothetical protein